MSSGYFDDKVAPLKRAAIDAFMKAQQWEVQGDHYEIPGNSTNKVSRPGEDGNGGGDWTGDFLQEWIIGGSKDEEFTGAFNDIRTKIDNALKPWRDIPEASEIATPVEAMRQANKLLSVGAVTTDGKVTGGGEISGNINLIIEGSDAMSGGLITTFKSDFLAQLSKAIGGQHAISIVLGGHLAAQEKMWDGAKSSVLSIIDQNTQAFRKAAEGNDFDWKVLIKVAGWAVAGASIFATGGATKALGVTNLGLTILDGVLPKDQETEKPAPEYQPVMDAFIRDLNGLADKIKAEETTMRDNIDDNLRQIRSDHGSYDLTRPAILDVDDDSDLHRNEKGVWEQIEIKPTLVKEITGTYMPNIADELFAAMGELEKTVDLTCLYRDPSIGIAQWGLNPEWHELRYLLYELLGNLGSETRFSAKTLDLAVDDIGQRDTDAQDALEKHAAQVKDEKVGESGGAQYDPWNVPRGPR